MGDADLPGGRTLLLTGYAAARPRGGPVQHQVSVGADHALLEQVRLTGLLDVGLPATSEARLALEGAGADLRLRSRSSSLALTVRAALEPDLGRADLAWGADAGLGLGAHRLVRTLGGTLRGLAGLRAVAAGPATEAVAVLRPSLGLLLVFRARTELSLRASGALYDRDPLTIGRLTAAELDAALAERAQALFPRLAGTSLLQNRVEVARAQLAGASAADGVLAAPLLVDARLALAHRFSPAVRAQLSYAFARYVPSQGHSHVLGTRWTWRASDRWRTWAGLSLQWDRLEDGTAEGGTAEGGASGGGARGPRPDALVTVGGELAF
jgi:hypothetical protein